MVQSAEEKKIVIQKWRAANKERLQIKSREDYQKNKEAKKKAVREYRAANKDKVKATRKTYYQKNKTKILAKVDKDQHREYNKKWSNNNKDKVSEYGRRTRRKHGPKKKAANKA